MRISSILLFAGLLVIGTVHAQAASVTPQIGNVYVNTGNGFELITSQTKAITGMKILIRSGGTAIINYDDGCAVRIGSGRVWEIAAKTPCADGNNYIDMAALTGRQGAEGDVVPSPETPPPGIDTTTLIIGGAVIAGGVGIAIAVSNNDDDPPPASP